MYNTSIRLMLLYTSTPDKYCTFSCTIKYGALLNYQTACKGIKISSTLINYNIKLTNYMLMHK